MTPEQLKVIEERWEKWINPESAPKTLGGDFLILLAEVRRLQAESKAKECCGNCRNSAINFSGGSKMLCKMRIMGAMNNYAKEKCEKWQGVK